MLFAWMTRAAHRMNIFSIIPITARVLALAILLLGSLPSVARADVTLFSGGGWRVDGVEDLTLGIGVAGSITVSTNGTVAGQFTELKIFSGVGSNSASQVYSVLGTGALRPNLPPPSVFGGSFHLTSYWDCQTGYVGPMAIVALDIQLSKKNGMLQLEGKASNFTSLEAKNLLLTLSPPAIDSVVMDISYDLTATRDFCVDQTHQNDAEGFMAAQITGKYFSPDNYDADFTRYIGITDKNCDPYSGCHVSTKKFCATLGNLDNPLFNEPHRLGNGNLFLLHTDTLPANTPTLIIDFVKPRFHYFKAHGLNAATLDPNIDNVVVWGNWNRVKKDYKRNKKIGKFEFMLEASPPGPRPCDNTSP